MVNEEKQIFHCFGCGKGGDMFTFLMEIESLEFREALKILAEKSGVAIRFSNWTIACFSPKSRVPKP